MEKAHSMELADRDKKIKVKWHFHTYHSSRCLTNNNLTLLQYLKSISQANTHVAVELRSELSKTHAEYSEDLIQQQIKHRNDIKAVRSRDGKIIDDLNSKLKDRSCELEETVHMAVEVSDEFNALSNERKAEAREYSKKQAHLESISQSRLQKLNQMKETESILRESLDSVKESADDQLASAHAQIASLMTQLADKNSTIEKLQSTV